MSWKRNENGTYQRPTDDTEHTIRTIEVNTGDTFHLCFSTKLAFADPTNLDHRLRQAWKRFGVKNPHVTVTWQQEGLANSSFVVTPLDTKEKLEQWASETFAVDNDSENAVQLTSLAPKDKRGLLTWVAKPRQLVLQITHSACDAYGAGYAFDEILTSVSKGLGPPTDLTVDQSSLAPTPLDGFGLSAENLDRKDVSHTRVAQEGFKQLMGVLGCATVPKTTIDASNPAHGFNGAMESYDLELTEDETARVVARAKELNATVGMYLCAAAGKAMQGYDHNGPHAKLCSAITIDRRGYFDQQRWDKPLGQYALAWPMSTDIYDKQFSEILDQVRDYLGRYTSLFRGGEEEGYHTTKVLGACSRALLGLVAQQYSCPFHWLLSSVGVFDPYLAHQYGEGANKIIVEDWKAQPRETVPGMATVLSTWGGKLRLQSVWNSELHDSEVMTRLADKFKDILLDSL